MPLYEITTRSGRKYRVRAVSETEARQRAIELAQGAGKGGAPLRERIQAMPVQVENTGRFDRAKDMTKGR